MFRGHEKSIKIGEGIVNDWPPLDAPRWGTTKRTLHLIAQMLGKTRLALAPYQPNFLFTALYLTPRGFTTCPFPVGLRLVELRVDVFQPCVEVISSGGDRRSVAFAELPNVAAIYGAVLRALRELDVEVTLSPLPQEVADTTPLDRDERPLGYESAGAAAWLTLMSSTQAVFERWRAPFFGRSSIVLWWGGFDFGMMLFSGKHVPPPSNRGYLFKYDLDAELVSAGFYPGDDANPPFYYGYIYPEPAGCATIDVAAGARWSEQLKEWILPYDAVRAAGDPEERLRAFLSGIYGAACSAAGWDASAYTYVAPPLRHGRLPS